MEARVRGSAAARPAGKLRQPARDRHALSRDGGHRPELGRHPGVPLVPLRQLDVRPGGRALPDPRPVLHAGHHCHVPLLARHLVWRRLAAGGLQDRLHGRGRPAHADRLLGQRHHRGLRPHPRGARQEPRFDLEDDQRQRQPDPEPHGARVIGDLAGGGRAVRVRRPRRPPVRVCHGGRRHRRHIQLDLHCQPAAAAVRRRPARGVQARRPRSRPATRTRCRPLRRAAGGAA